jgi:hypothetical protein
MARQPLQAEYTSFIRGLITEASPFTYPENASLEEVNFVLNTDGSRKRRLGMDYEEDYSLVDTGVDVTNPQVHVSSFAWPAVANRGDLEFSVVQIGNKLYFYKTNNGAISANPVNSGTPITISGNATEAMSVAAAYGKLIVAHGTQEVSVLSYNPITDVISVAVQRLRVRDLFGLADGLEIDERPATLSVEHEYNLRNQGWPTSFNCTSDLSANTTTDPIPFTFTHIAAYPSNADIIWAAKASSATAVSAVNSYYPKELQKIAFGTTRAPLGSKILDVFNRGADRGVGLPADQSEGGVVSVASYAGRVFYAVRETGTSGFDANSPSIGTMVFYSQAKDNVKSLVSCYAEADPTSEQISDPIATDGGFVTIPDMGQVLRLMTMGQSLFVFCTNGVWEIHGGEESFSATNQNVTKTTDIAPSSTRSIVYAEDSIAFWSQTGIYRISRNDLTLRGSNNDLTAATIQTFYDDIDDKAKTEAVGVYDPFTRSFRWLYRDAVLPNAAFFNKELVFDVLLNAFYVFEIKVPTFTYPFVAGYAPLNNILSVDITNSVIITSGSPSTDYDVLAVSDDVVVSPLTSESIYKSSIKYLTLLQTAGTHKFTFSHYRDKTFTDWKTFNGVGVDAEARMLSGAATGGSAMVKKAIDYIYVYMKRTEVGLDNAGAFIDPSSCLIQIRWDWVNSSSAGRWSREFEAYRLPRIFMFDADAAFDYGYTTVITKNRLRGSGQALSFVLKTKPKHNCHIYGWGIMGSVGVA